MFSYGVASGVYTGTSTTQSVSGTDVSIGISSLSSGTTYYYRITANSGAGTSTGNEASFATTSAPVVEPTPIKETLTVTSTSPASGATGVGTNTAVSATFSLIINGSTLTPDTFKLQSDGGAVTGSVTTNSATATFTPASSMAYNTTYTATITTGAQAANFAGTTLASNHSWSFTTESAPIVPTPTPTATPSPTPAATPTATPIVTLTATPTESPTPTATPVGTVIAALDLSKSVAYLNGDTIFARVVDADRDTNASTADILTTALKAAGTTYFSGDLLLDMVENDENSGTFLATIRTGTTTTGGAGRDIRSNYGIIKTQQGGTATVIYRDTTPLSASLTKDVFFSSFDATIEFSADTYPLDSYASVTLADAEKNTDHAEAETILDQVFISTSAFNFAVMEFIETGADTGTFMGSMLVSNAPTEAKKNIQASEGQTLTVGSQDEINTFGAMRIVSDTALVVAAVTATPTETPTPTVTPTPVAECKAKEMTATPSELTVQTGGTDTITITVTGKDGCLVAGDRVKASVKKGKNIIEVSPSTQVTDENGQAVFTVTSKGKKGNAAIEFRDLDAGGVKAKVDVNVVETLPTPTATPTITITPTPTATATPTPCEPESISVSPAKSLTLLREEDGEVTVTVSGDDGDCQAAGVTVTATTNKAGAKRISISPTSAKSDANGEVTFTITAKNKTGNERITFKAEGVKKPLKYTVKVKKK